MIAKNKVKIDYAYDSLFDEMGMRRLKDSYLNHNEKSPQERFSYVARSFGSDPAHAQRLYDYAKKHWLSFSTPILAYGISKKALPISCYLSYVDDSAEALVDTLSEVNWLSMLGGGVGIGIGIRAEDEKSVGVMPHLKVYEAASLAFRQGKTRRGSFAAYLAIDHPNIVQFIDMRKPTGDTTQRCLELNHGINISDKFMELIERCTKDVDADDSWELIDPHTKLVKEVVSAKRLWEAILDTRMRTGEPYIHFIDASNRALPEFQKKLGLSVKQSNICTEITLPTDSERTAVCCLSSVNLTYYDDWKHNKLFIADIAEMLDNVLEVFIKKAPKQVARAVYSAKRERAIGVGALGFHELLQKRNMPFESASASSLNRIIFKDIREQLDQANRRLARLRGECPDAEGYGLRFSHVMAIAPNASSSILMGNTSPSIEPFRANAYRQDTMSGMFLNKNKQLEKLLLTKGLSKEDLIKVWQVIVSSAGSVKNIDVLTDWEKDVYKTATEIDQRWVIAHAVDRQKSIDQAQSVNLNFVADTTIPYLHDVHFRAWKQGLKTLYYCRSNKIYHGDSMNKSVDKVELTFSNKNDCLACEG